MSQKLSVLINLIFVLMFISASAGANNLRMGKRHLESVSNNALSDVDSTIDGIETGWWIQLIAGIAGLALAGPTYCIYSACKPEHGRQGAIGASLITLFAGAFSMAIGQSVIAAYAWSL